MNSFSANELLTFFGQTANNLHSITTTNEHLCDFIRKCLTILVRVSSLSKDAEGLLEIIREHQKPKKMFFTKKSNEKIIFELTDIITRHNGEDLYELNQWITLLLSQKGEIEQSTNMNKESIERMEKTNLEFSQKIVGKKNGIFSRGDRQQIEGKRHSLSVEGDTLGDFEESKLEKESEECEVQTDGNITGISQEILENIREDSRIIKKPTKLSKKHKRRKKKGRSSLGSDMTQTTSSTSTSSAYYPRHSLDIFFSFFAFFA